MGGELHPLDVRRMALGALTRIARQDPDGYRRLRPDLRPEIADIMRIRLRTTP